MRKALTGASGQGAILLGVCLAALPGCMFPMPVARIQVLDYGEDGQVRQYEEAFEECVYDIDSAGNLRLVMHRPVGGSSMTDNPYGISQMLYVDGIWHSVAGKNPFHKTQINGTVTYAVTGRGVAITYEGGGAIHFSENRAGTELKGTIDHAVMLPKRSLATADPVFKKAEIYGDFKAKRDPRRVTRLSNDVNRMFGPLAMQEALEPSPGFKQSSQP